MRIIVLDSYTTDQGEDCWQELRALGETSVYPRTRPEQVLERIAGAAIVLTNKVILGAPPMGPDLRYIGLLSTGTNAVDLEAAKARGVAVTNVPGYSTDSVAQLVFAHILRFTNDVSGHDADVKAGRWAAGEDFCFVRQPLVELRGKTLVVLGGGAIGSEVTRIAEAFRMRIILAQVPGSATPGRMPLREALPLADFVTLHCPLTEKTRGMVDGNFLRVLKPSALLINTGRGPLVNEADLIDALEKGSLAGAALDVLSQEPPPKDHPLLNPKAPWARKVSVTPHIAWATVEARHRLVKQVVENLESFLTGKSLNRVA